MVYSIAICDDKSTEIESIIKEFDKVFSKYRHSNIVFERHSYVDPNKLIKDYKDENYDLIFLDIEMPIMDGFSVAERLAKISANVKIVFVTSHNNFIFDSLQHTPLEFIRKDKLLYDLKRKSDYIFSKIQKDEVIFVITQNNVNIKLKLSDIIYIENIRNDITIHTQDGNNFTIRRKTLSDFVDELNYNNIVQIHRSYAVNVEFVYGPPQRGFVKIIKNGIELSVGSKFKNDFIEKFMEYSRGFII